MAKRFTLMDVLRHFFCGNYLTKQDLTPSATYLPSQPTVFGLYLKYHSNFCPCLASSGTMLELVAGCWHVIVYAFTSDLPLGT